jgi:hypothetical protein
MGSTTKPEGAGEERREEPYPSAESYEQESLETVGVADDGETLLDAMKSWLRQEECGGLTVSQSGALMALATFRSGTPLGRYLERLVKPGSDVGAEGSRQRSLLPLPLLPDSITEMSKLFETGEFKRLAGFLGAQKDKQREGRQGDEESWTAGVAWDGGLFGELSLVRRRSQGPCAQRSSEQGPEVGQ